MRRRQDFAAAVRHGRRVGRPLLVAYLLCPRVSESRDGVPARVGFVVGRSVGSAVDRNVVRRRLRHLVRERLAALPPSTLLVIRALAGAGEAPAGRLAEDLDAACARLSLSRERAS
jgi:ribonuclease P protein component